MIEKLLDNIKKQDNESFKKNFSGSVNNSHRTLLLETAAIYDNLEAFTFLKSRTSIDSATLLRLSLSNLSQMKSYKPEYLMLKEASPHILNNITALHVKHICRLGDKACLDFFEQNPIAVHIHFNWFIHYSLQSKNEEFLTYMFNQNISREQVINSCIMVILNKEETFLPIILENSFEKGVNVDFHTNKIETQNLIKKYFRSNSYSVLAKQNEANKQSQIIQLLTEENIKALEAVLYEATEGIHYENNKGHKVKF